jgi:hypothetical protein
MTTFDATHDPSDDKLRLRASSRLDAETYARVKAAGFGWAPKQDLFYAVWSPAREDLLVELAATFDDEETSLEERAPSAPSGSPPTRASAAPKPSRPARRSRPSPTAYPSASPSSLATTASATPAATPSESRAACAGP